MVPKRLRMNNLLFLLFLGLHSGFVSSGNMASFESDRTKREPWMDIAQVDPQDEQKYIWFCRECDASGLLRTMGSMAPKCEYIYSLFYGDDTYDKRNCNGTELCELLSKTDPNELPPGWKSDFEGDGSELAPGWMVDINIHRYCCDRHQICDQRMSKAAIAHKCQNPDSLNELDRRTCCKLEGLACDRKVGGKDMDWFIEKYRCEQEPSCYDHDFKELLDCCSMVNMSCSSPMCTVEEYEIHDTCEATDFIPPPGEKFGMCLFPWEYGKCCEFRNKCNGLLCYEY